MTPSHGDPSEVLNRITAPDAYTVAATIQGTQISRVIFDVANQAIFWQLMKASGGLPVGDWEAVETYMLPGSRVITRPGIVGVRVRAALPLAQIPAGSFQAVVTVEAVK